MEKVDRLGWTAGLSFTAYGASVGVRVNEPSLLPRVVDLLPPAWASTPNPVVDSLFSLYRGAPSSRPGRRNYHLLYAGAGRLARSLELNEVFDVLENYLRITVAYWAKEDHLFIHAGVVGWQGKAILIPGRSFTGKTTLVSALIQAGAAYYSDEMAILDPQSRVHPYPIPLSVREEQGKCKVAPETLGGHVGQEPLPVGLVVITEYAVGAAWQPRTLTPGRALMALLDNTVAARRDPKVSLPILRQVVAHALTVKSRRGEAKEAAASLLAAVKP